VKDNRFFSALPVKIGRAATRPPCRPVAFFPAAAYKPSSGRADFVAHPASRKWCQDLIKRLAVWAFYLVGTLAVAYLALFAYAMWRGHPDIVPGDPIRIFRKPDAPSYS
jgi:hypothetical protein